MRTIEADKLKREFSEACQYSGAEVRRMIDISPTAGATTEVEITDGLSNITCGYYDKTRDLIFTKYGMATPEALRTKGYTITEAEGNK